MKRILSVLICVWLLIGCSTPGSIVKRLAKDPSSLHLKVMGPGWTVELDRTNPSTNTPTLSIKDGEIIVTKDASPGLARERASVFGNADLYRALFEAGKAAGK